MVGTDWRDWRIAHTDPAKARLRWLVRPGFEAAVRDRVRGFIQAMIEGELDGILQRPRYVVGRSRWSAMPGWSP
jgi:hypothetical protein